MMDTIKQHVRHFFMGAEHAAVALTSILFVAATLSSSPRNAFLAVGISTIIFHIFTHNKLSSVLGISASYIGGMLLIQQSFGQEAVAFGVLGIGLIYLVLGVVLKNFPNLLNKIPIFIFKLSVVYIALLLIPIGWSMASSNLGYLTLGLLAVLSFIPRVKNYALPLSLVIMGGLTYSLGMWTEPAALDKIALITPAFNVPALTSISLVSIAVIGEVFGDTSATAMINDVELGKDVKWSEIFSGMGVANFISSLFGMPTVSYSENNGFLRSIGSRDLHPTAQIYTGFIFIAMAFIPGIAGFLSMIPFPIYGALLLFLFISLGVKTVIEIEPTNKKTTVAVVSMIAFVLSYNSTVVSPITVAFFTSLVSYYILDNINMEVFK